MHTLRNNRAFTIVELLVVVVVIAILASIVIVSYNGVQKSAKTATLQSDLRSAATAIAVEINHNNLASVTTFPSTVKPSSKVGLSLAVPASGSTYCINGAYADSATLRYYFDSTAGMKEGACPGAYIAGTAIGDSSVAPTEPPTGPVVLVSDNFDRSNSTSSLGSAQTGQAWTSYQGTWGISSNRAYPVNNNENDTVVIDSGNNNSEISTRIYNIGSNTFPGLLARASPSDAYIAEISGTSGRIELARMSGFQVEATAPDGTYTAGALLTLRTRTVSGGVQLTVLVNNIQVLQVIDTAASPPSGTYAGFRYGTYNSGTNYNIRFDDFSITSL